MDSNEFLQAITDIVREKGVKEDVMYDALEAALLAAYKKDFGNVENVAVKINKDEGVVKLIATKEVVEVVENSNFEISLQDARSISKLAEIGHKMEVDVTPKKYGRIAAQTAKQVVVQRLREAERTIVYEEFVDREEDIVSGLIQRIEQKNVFINLGKTEAILPPAEQIEGEDYNMNQNIKAYVLEVKNSSKGPQIFVSRSHPGMVKRLFEREVPEIHEGIIEVRAVSREAGYRSKISVVSSNPDVDPVGACVGPKGMRVQAIVSELRGEKIDIIKYSEDPKEYISQALSPSKVLDVIPDEKEKVSTVIVPDDQLSLAIGKEGQNARLAAKLTGWKIDIKCESQLN
ncbi:transcription termination factor NusA [Proteinivorax tanatarense]|uniref:Transcription termination/antitermination protein NusA n=1 Tax=Proteinivorax tanatarense TaxID=1260629 RepID=A0AAU7VR30_9FIRM